jgi:AAA15 family ATPase/GTPase
MKNQITDIEIKNFKTLKNVEIKCKRINIFIGKPNVGKSNLLEALSLFCAPYSDYNNRKYLSDFIRYKNFEDLFFDKEIGNQIEINTNIGSAVLRYHFNIHQYDLILTNDRKVLKKLPTNSLQEIEQAFKNHSSDYKKQSESIMPAYFIINANGELKSNPSLDLSSPVKKYYYERLKEFPSRYHLFLGPPDGKNLYTIIQHNKKLFKQINDLFKEYKLRLLLDSDKSHLFVQKIISGISFSYDYYGVADTIQRYIFNLLAIETNKDSILLFEEPEAHSFPKYVRDFAQKVIESRQNQFFITTHSPFVLNTILENAPNSDVAVFIVDYKRYQTVLSSLSEKKINNFLNFGNDIIFNI